MSEPIKPKRYFCLFNDDAVSQGYLNAEDSREYGSSIFRRNDDGTVTLVGEDGGEPEDQTLNRDWKWVIEALNRLARCTKAYGGWKQSATYTRFSTGATLQIRT